MKRKRIISIAAALALMLSVMIPVLAVEEEAPEAPEGAKPRLTIVGTGIKDTEYFEVSLFVDVEQFQTAGVVLSYDTEVLRPVDWTEAGTEVQLGSAWNSPNAAVPAVGADVQKEGAVRTVSGKPALAYEVQDALEADYGRGYLYLGADALRYEDLEHVRVVTVRFKYAQGKSFDDVSMPTSVAKSSDSMGLSLAPAEIAQEAIPHARALLTTGNPDGITVDCYTYAEDIREGSGDLECEVVFEKIPDGKSVSAGGSSMGGDYAITFFDWDGRVIDAITAPQDARERVDTYTRMLTDDSTSLLRTKAGYDFACWLYVTQGKEALETEHDTFVADKDRTVFVIDEADFSDLSQYAGEGKDHWGLSVQAAYVENADCNSGVSDGTNIYYTIDEEHAVYTRYGSASATDGRYSVTYTVRRENSAGKGVTKLHEPAVFVTMKPNLSDPTQNLITKLDLMNTDETTFEVVPVRKIQEVSVYLIDTYGFSAWPGAGARSTTVNCRNATFVLNGSWGFVRDQAIETLKLPNNGYLDPEKWSESWSRDADAATFRDGGLTIPNGVSLETAKKRILGHMAKLTEEQRRAVTQTQLNSMIAREPAP